MISLIDLFEYEEPGSVPKSKRASALDVLFKASVAGGVSGVAGLGLAKLFSPSSDNINFGHSAFPAYIGGKLGGLGMGGIYLLDRRRREKWDAKQRAAKRALSKQSTPSG